MIQMLATSHKVKDKMLKLGEAKLAEASSDEALQALIDSYTTSRAPSV